MCIIAGDDSTPLDGATDAMNELHDSHPLQLDKAGITHGWANSAPRDVFKVNSFLACYNEEWEPCVALAQLKHADFDKKEAEVVWCHPTMSGNATWVTATWDTAYYTYVMHTLPALQYLIMHTASMDMHTSMSCVFTVLQVFRFQSCIQQQATATRGSNR
jgi:hypothetical protein